MLSATTTPDEVFDASSSQERLENGIATSNPGFDTSDAFALMSGRGESPNWASANSSLRNEVRDWVSAFRAATALLSAGHRRAALVALAITGQQPELPRLHGSWMVLTAVVVTQVSVGGSLRATLDYVVGTLAGAVYAAVIGLLVPHVTALGQDLALTLAVAPLSLAAALRPNFRVAPFSAVLVLLIGGALGENPAISAVVRVLEVALGGAIAAAVSMLVFPERAHKLGIEAASRILRDMASLLPAVLDAFTQSADLNGARAPRQDDLGRAVGAFDDLVAEARRERMVFLHPRCRTRHRSRARS